MILRPSNNYGPFQFPEKLIPLVILNSIEEKKLPVYGRGRNIRNWLHVEDNVEAIKKIIFKGKIGNIYNIGGKDEISNIQLVKIICKILNRIYPRKKKKYEDLIKYVDDRPGHDYRYAVNCNKISNTLDWKPQISFDDGIEKTVNWYVDHSDWWGKIIEKKYNLKRLGTVK